MALDFGVEEYQDGKCDAAVEILEEIRDWAIKENISPSELTLDGVLEKLKEIAEAYGVLVEDPDGED